MRKLSLLTLMVIALSVPVLAGDTGMPPCKVNCPPPCTENCGSGMTAANGFRVLAIKAILAFITN